MLPFIAAMISFARRLLVLAQQRDGRQDLPRHAVAALHRLLVEKRLLHGMQLVAVGQALDRRDLAGADFGRRS